MNGPAVVTLKRKPYATRIPITKEAAKPSLATTQTHHQAKRSFLVAAEAIVWLVRGLDLCNERGEMRRWVDVRESGVRKKEESGEERERSFQKMKESVR